MLLRQVIRPISANRAVRWLAPALPALRLPTRFGTQTAGRWACVVASVSQRRSLITARRTLVPTEKKQEREEDDEGSNKASWGLVESVFNNVWKGLEEKYGRKHLRFPKELLLLNGAPGSGKGTIAEFVMKARHITHIAVSDLLHLPEHETVKNTAELVNDAEVLQILLEELLKPKHEHGVVIDGFPRTPIQAECLRLLYKEMLGLRAEFFNSDIGQYFRRPIFHIVMLYIEEDVSVARQLDRGKKIAALNEVVRESGEGKIVEIRQTDREETAARERYRVFRKQGYEPLKNLKDEFHYHFIAADGPIEEVRQLVVRNFEYQSSLELGDKTFELLNRLPRASSIGYHFRQDIVEKLDFWADHQPELLSKVIGILNRDFIPIIKLCLNSGEALIRTQDEIFFDYKKTVEMAVCVLADRGFQVSIRKGKDEVPRSLDPITNQISTYTRAYYEFFVRYPRGRM